MSKLCLASILFFTMSIAADGSAAALSHAQREAMVPAIKAASPLLQQEPAMRECLMRANRGDSKSLSALYIISQAMLDADAISRMRSQAMASNAPTRNKRSKINEQFSRRELNSLRKTGKNLHKAISYCQSIDPRAVK